MTQASLDARARAVLNRAGLLDARVCVALSGGVDSCVLLDVLVRLALRHPLRLSAVHVNHGLSRSADRWAAFCQARCADLGIALRVQQVRIECGVSIETAARAARYAVFETLPVDAIALAHNLDDQAETMLLRLNRGAGVHGLAGIPLLRTLPGGTRLVRPLLSTSRAEILGHAAARGLAWVEDESNRDPRFDRNYVRLELMPRIERRFPRFRETWRRAADNLADAAGLLDDLAASDAGAGVAPDRLALSTLRALSPARARNLLRWFIARQGVAIPGRERVEEALRQLLDADVGSHPEITFAGMRLRRHGDAVIAGTALPDVPPGWEQAWGGEDVLHLDHGLGMLRFVSACGSGLSEHCLLGGHVRVVVRRGGERLRLASDRPARTLKNLLRERDVPTWLRGRLPVLTVDGRLAWVAQVGVDCRFAAGPGERGVLPHWEPPADERASAQPVP